MGQMEAVVIYCSLTCFQCDGGLYFTCNDGMCIDICMRCDGRSDCADESDEKNCNLVFIDKDKYRKESIPKLISGDAQLNVWVEIDVFGISAIRELKGDFKIDFSLGLTWYDSRLTFQNLKASSTLSVLSSDS